MKLFKKLYYQALFTWLLSSKKRQQNKDINNKAGLTVLNPVPSVQPQHIPKIIWMYWEGNQSALLKACIQRIRNLHPDYEVYLLDPKSVKVHSQLEFSDPIIEHATPQQRADLIRFDLIYHYGGIWLDASSLVYEKLDWIDELIQETHTQSFSYYRAKNTTNLNYPVIENWLLASVPNNVFYRHWLEALYQALKIGPQKYIEEIKKKPHAADLFQEIGRLEYLIAYVVCQQVMRQYPISMVLINCDQNAFFYQVSNQWMKEKVLIDLAVSLAPNQMPYLIKLAGKERKILDTHYRLGKYLPNSLLDI